jgi:hypothetical protein
VDDTKGLASNSDYESFSEYATPPPETRSTDPTSFFSTPADDVQTVADSKHTPIQPVTNVAAHAIGERGHSPSVIPPLTNSFDHGVWEKQAVSNTSDLSHEALHLLSSSNPLTIDGILNKSVSESTHREINQSDTHREESTPIPPIYSDRPVWPLTDPAEALLLRHFVQNLAIWVRSYRNSFAVPLDHRADDPCQLDLCDPKQHFQVDVPRRAGSCRILLNAIFALSARHLCRVGRHHDTLASNRYHDECLKYLIPMLNDTATVSDESLFAATIILRVLEEIDGKLTATSWMGKCINHSLAPELDSQGHRLGIQIFVGARDPLSGGLSEAAFWVGLRQEIYTAMMNHQSTQLNLEHISIDRSFGFTSDYGWSNRAIVHCADVLNCCFGDSGISIRHWEELKQYGERWQESLPSSFTPIYYRAPDRSGREAFPEIWYSLSCHSQFKMCQLL